MVGLGQGNNIYVRPEKEFLKKGLTWELIVLGVGKGLKDGMYVNLGFGLPTLTSPYGLLLKEGWSWY